MSRWISTLTGGNGIILIAGLLVTPKSTTAASIIDHIRQHNQTGDTSQRLRIRLNTCFGETNPVVTQREIGVHYVDYAQAARGDDAHRPTIVFLHEILNASAAQAALSWVPLAT